MKVVTPELPAQLSGNWGSKTVFSIADTVVCAPRMCHSLYIYKLVERPCKSSKFQELTELMSYLLCINGTL